MEDVREAPPAGKTQSKGKPDETAAAESKEDKKARRKARRAKRLQEKADAE